MTSNTSGMDNQRSHLDQTDSAILDHLAARQDLHPYAPLTDQEIDAFFADIDRDNDGFVTFSELEAKLEHVHMELAPEPRAHHLHHPARRWKGRESNDEEKAQQKDPEHDGLHEFLGALLPHGRERLSKAEFSEQVKRWAIPSQEQTSTEDEDRSSANEEHKLPFGRRLKARWSVQGPKVLFVTLVVCLQLGFGIWQMVKYINSQDARAALGWGVIMAKAAAGAIYPTFFFMILSMSRWFATFMRRFYYISRVANWDRHQSFHIWMACVGLVLATLHAIGHLTGTFLYGSRPSQQDDLAILLGPDAVPKPYAAFVRTLPGWTGVTCLSMYWLIALLSLPAVRAWSYEVFQLAHLLMFPMIGLLCAHGTAALLQDPMLGYWLAFPTLLVIAERGLRIIRGFMSVPARMEILDDETVMLSCKHPSGHDWNYEAGQYVFLQVPDMSLLQWHPFTVSTCRGNVLQLHIKTDGDWTSRLRLLSTDRETRVGIDGPYGAPAQRFYEFDRSLIIGAGVGVTPFSAIICDIEQRLSEKTSQRSQESGWHASHRPSASLEGSKTIGYDKAEESGLTDDPSRLVPQRPIDKETHRPSAGHERLGRRVDFHWMVREKNHLAWFSSLLNKAHELSLQLPPSCLDLRLHTHITAKRKNISTHVFRYLLDSYRTSTSPYSALTGLKLQSHFGRPDFAKILERYHKDMKNDWTGEKVGIFFCGSPTVGSILADACSELTARSRADGSKIRYIFVMEVFG